MRAFIATPQIWTFALDVLLIMIDEISNQLFAASAQKTNFFIRHQTEICGIVDFPSPLTGLPGSLARDHLVGRGKATRTP